METENIGPIDTGSDTVNEKSETTESYDKEFVHGSGSGHHHRAGHVGSWRHWNEPQHPYPRGFRESDDRHYGQASAHHHRNSHFGPMRHWYVSQPYPPRGGKYTGYKDFVHASVHHRRSHFGPMRHWYHHQPYPVRVSRDPDYRDFVHHPDHRMSNFGPLRHWVEPHPLPWRGVQEGYFTNNDRPLKESNSTSPPLSPPGNSSPPLSGHFPPLAASSPVGTLRPQPHINPEFLRRGCLPELDSVSPYSSQHECDSKSPQGLTTEEYESAMSKVKTLASTAMARAVKDAEAGDSADSIETLVTAISLLRQSKVGDDSSVKIMIASLQDTLENVERKSYGNGPRSPRGGRSPRNSYYRECSRSPRSYSQSRRRHREDRDRYSSEHTYGDYSHGKDHDEYVPRPKSDYERSHEYRSSDSDSRDRYYR